MAAAVGVVLATRQAERTLLAHWDRTTPARAPALRADIGEARQRWVRTDDGASLRVLEWGTGRPVVLVHGITASAEDWLPVIPLLLAAGHRVVAVDQRGHGASTLGQGRCDTSRLADDLAHVLGELDLRQAVLAGHSLGGYVGLALAGRHPELAAARLTALVVLGAPHTGRGVRELLTLASVAFPLTPRLQRSPLHGPVVTGLVAFGAAPDRRGVDDVRLRWARCDMATRRCFARHLAGERVTPLLDRIDVPVVVARGSRDHVVTARRNAALARGLRRARPGVLPGAGHALLCERPEAVAAVISEAAARTA